MQYALEDQYLSRHFYFYRSMRFLKGILFCGLLLWVSTVKAQGHFELTAYRFAISLQNDKAEQKIGEIKRNDPDNLLVYHIENYVDFFEVFINEDKERFEELEKNRERRLEKIKSGDEESPYYRFCQAEVKL